MYKNRDEVVQGELLRELPEPNRDKMRRVEAAAPTPWY
jgi:hypothetical protein